METPALLITGRTWVDGDVLLGVRHSMGFPGGDSGKEPEHACQCRRCKRHRFDPWVGKIPWRRAWQLIPEFLPGEFHGQRSLVGYRSWGRKESDTTEVTEHVCKTPYKCNGVGKSEPQLILPWFFWISMCVFYHEIMSEFPQTVT